MERRTKFILLIIVALLLLALGLWILLQPIFQPGPQPPPLPGKVTPTTVLPPTTPFVQPGTPTTPVPQDLKQLENLAVVFVSRVGSGASGEGFRGFDDVLINATPQYRDTLRAEQKAMQTAHPASGPAYGIVSRVVAVQNSGAVFGADTVTFVLQVQQTEDAGNPSAPTRVFYKEATVVLEKQPDGTYLVGNVVWKDLQI